MESKSVPHSRYQSFENSYRDKTVEYFQQFLDEKQSWVALEKVHGMNFNATVTAQEIRWGSRSDYLDSGTKFLFQGFLGVIMLFGC